jgi:D-glycero-D-manno-heptose 1,7-bisphosphate phosphatase
MSTNLPTKKFNTLFLDRDGVINKKIENGYVLTWEDFKFEPNVVEKFHTLNKFFNRIILVTNQKCVGTGLLPESALYSIHEKMKSEILSNSGIIDKIYFCPGTLDSDYCRKPNPGMFYQSKSDFPDITFNKYSFMVGDSLTDLIPAKKLGMSTIYVNVEKVRESEEPLIDFQVPSLMKIDWEFISRTV